MFLYFKIHNSFPLGLIQSFVYTYYLKSSMVKIYNSAQRLNKAKLRGRHSSVVSSTPTIMRSRVRTPSTPSTFFNWYYWILNEKRTKIDEKEGEIGPYILKMRQNFIVIFLLYRREHSTSKSIWVCKIAKSWRQSWSSPTRKSRPGSRIEGKEPHSHVEFKANRAAVSGTISQHA